MPKVEVMHIGGLQGEVIDLGDHYVFEIAGNEEQGCCLYCEAITPYKHGIKQPHYPITESLPYCTLSVRASAAGLAGKASFRLTFSLLIHTEHC